MTLSSLFRTKPKKVSTSDVSAKPVITEPVVTEKRKVSLGRRGRADRRTGKCQAYMGASRRETIDRREIITERRSINVH